MGHLPVIVASYGAPVDWCSGNFAISSLQCSLTVLLAVVVLTIMNGACSRAMRSLLKISLKVNIFLSLCVVITQLRYCHRLFT